MRDYKGGITKVVDPFSHPRMVLRFNLIGRRLKYPANKVFLCSSGQKLETRKRFSFPFRFSRNNNYYFTKIVTKNNQSKKQLSENKLKSFFWHRSEIFRETLKKKTETWLTFGFELGHFTKVKRIFFVLYREQLKSI